AVSRGVLSISSTVTTRGPDESPAPSPGSGGAVRVLVVVLPADFGLEARVFLEPHLLGLLAPYAAIGGRVGQARFAVPVCPRREEAGAERLRQVVRVQPRRDRLAVRLEVPDAGVGSGLVPAESHAVGVGAARLVRPSDVDAVGQAPARAVDVDGGKRGGAGGTGVGPRAGGAHGRRGVGA